MIDFVCMPPQIEAAGQSRILKIFVRIGQAFDTGEILFAYEYDGARLEERATHSGMVSAIFFKEGDILGGNTPIIAYERT